MGLVIQSDTNGNNFGFSFQKFQKWKKIFKRKYKEYYGKNFSEDFPDKNVRIAIYEKGLRVQGTNILKGLEVDLEQILNIEKVNNILSLVQDSKE